MQRGLAVLVAALMIIGVAVPIGGALAQDDASGEADEAEDVRPGERLSGVVGVQKAELDGEIESRSFGVRIAQAETDDARADVVADRLQRNEMRLDELETRKEELRERRDAGEISEGTYRAKVAQSAAEIENVRRTTNRSAEVAAELPEELLVERGIDAERIGTIRERANGLTGPEVAEIARGIAGDRVGAPMGPDHDRPDVGPTPDSDRPDVDREQRPDDAKNTTETRDTVDEYLERDGE